VRPRLDAPAALYSTVQTADDEGVWIEIVETMMMPGQQLSCRKLMCLVVRHVDHCLLQPLHREPLRTFRSCCKSRGSVEQVGVLNVVAGQTAECLESLLRQTDCPVQISPESAKTHGNWCSGALHPYEVAIRCRKRLKYPRVFPTSLELHTAAAILVREERPKMYVAKIAARRMGTTQ
jgi:hypothetical protein